MALTRARVLYGPPEARARLDRILHDVLCDPRDPERLKLDVLKMRAEMAVHKQPSGRARRQAAARRAGRSRIPDPLSPIARTDRLYSRSQRRAGPARCGRAPVSPRSCDAHALLTRILVAARLLAPDGKEPPSAACAALAKACGAADYAGLLENLGAARQEVAAAWSEIFQRRTGDRMMSERPDIGDMVPDIALTAPDGTAVKPSDFRGQAAGAVLLSQGRHARLHGRE